MKKISTSDLARLKGSDGIHLHLICGFVSLSRVQRVICKAIEVNFRYLKAALVTVYDIVLILK